MQEETKTNANSPLKEVFQTIKKLDLETNKEGIIAIGFSPESEDSIGLIGSVQGNRNHLVEALSLAIDSDQDLWDIIREAMTNSMIKKLKSGLED